MPAPLLAMAASVVGEELKRRGLPPWLLVLIPIVLAVGLLMSVASLGGAGRAQAKSGGTSVPSEFALADIPGDYMRLYESAAKQEGLDWAVLAGIGRIETNHGRLDARGVKSGYNCAGAAGPMQFGIGVGDHGCGDASNAWATYGHDANKDGKIDVYDPEDAIPAAAKKLRADGAPGDYQLALRRYNDSGEYIAAVLDWAEKYRKAYRAATPGFSAADVRDVLDNPRITLTAVQRADLQSGAVDRRIVAVMTWIGRNHSMVVTSLKTDHSPGGNHPAGRAMDIGSVDGEICRGSRQGACGRLALELARITGPLHLTELIYCFDPDPASPDAFAMSDHCDHIHAGYDAVRNRPS